MRAPSKDLPITKPNSRVKIVTMGCSKNEVDSEEIAGVLKQSGFTTVSDESAEIIVINTCGFLEASKQESIAAIRAAVQLKKLGKAQKVIVAGCLAQRMGADLMKEAPGADGYFGVGQMGRFHEVIAQVQNARNAVLEISAPNHRWADVSTRARAGSPWSAYLKVSEGCDHKCTFCTIPSFRGRHQSKPIERILKEARFLVEGGAREINLIAQDVTQYGFDLYQKFTLPRLLKELDAIEGIDWIRILYFYPNRLTDEVIDAMTKLPSVLPYIDIPLQHAHPDVLRRMKRPGDGARYLELFSRVRLAMPQVAIRTTFMVGFPGETEEEFNCLLDFIKEARLDRVGAFTYSREQGTPSFELEGQVPFRVKRERYERLMETQQSISFAKNLDWVDREIDVLVEGFKDGVVIGRSFRDAPEIDGLVFVEIDDGLEQGCLGEIRKVKVTRADAYDLFGSWSA